MPQQFDDTPEDRPRLPSPVDLDDQRQYEHGFVHPNDHRLQGAMNALEDEIAQYTPKPKLEPLPDYVEPRNGVPPVGALSAEALVRDFEKTAKDIENMAAELNEAAQRSVKELMSICDDYAKLAAGIKEVVEHVKETAAMYRDEAKSVFVRIEDTTLRMQEVRELSAAMRDRLTLSSIGDGSTRLPPINFNQSKPEGEGQQKE